MKTKTKAIEHENLIFSVSQQVDDILPKVLIDYLFSLVEADQKISGQRHTFRLDKSQLGSEEIQDIFHTGENNAFEAHRVFGYKPVVADIAVTCDNTGYYMSLSNDALAAGVSSDSRIKAKTPFLVAASCNI